MMIIILNPGLVRMTLSRTMSSVLADLKTRLSNSSSNNNNGSNRNDLALEAILSRYDGVNKGDGEMEVMTKQLSSQMEYNNLLLEHLQVDDDYYYYYYYYYYYCYYYYCCCCCCCYCSSSSSSPSSFLTFSMTTGIGGVTTGSPA